METKRGLVEVENMADEMQKNEIDESSPLPSSQSTFEEKVQAEMEKAKDMKIGELKLKLQAQGVLTSTFCEKAEFVRAYAESVVRAAEKPNPFANLANTKQHLSRNKDEEVDDDDDDDYDDDDEQEGMESHLPQYVQRRVEKLKELHEERERGLKEYLAERAKLEAKYQALAQPLYGKRADIIAGKLDEEIDNANKNGLEDGDGEDSDKVKGIPQFWVLALAHMEVVADLLTEEDIACLDSLEDIKCIDNEDGQGFTLSFHFAENDYFENTVLTKKYDVPNLLLGDEPILKNVEGCEIQWKKGKCLTSSQVTHKQRGKGKNAGQVRTVVKNENRESFFHFFSPPKMPNIDNMSEEEAVQLEATFDADYDIAQAFRSHIIPKAILWYTGQAMEHEMDAALDGLQWPQDGRNKASDGDTPECKQS